MKFVLTMQHLAFFVIYITATPSSTHLNLDHVLHCLCLNKEKTKTRIQRNKKIKMRDKYRVRSVEPCNNRLKFRSILTVALSFWDGNTMKSGFWFVVTVFSFCMVRGKIRMIRHMRKWHLIKRHFVECIDWRLFIGTIDKIEIMISLLAFQCSKEVNGIFFDLLISIPEKSVISVTKFHSNHIQCILFTANQRNGELISRNLNLHFRKQKQIIKPYALKENWARHSIGNIWSDENDFCIK